MPKSPSRKKAGKPSRRKVLDDADNNGAGGNGQTAAPRSGVLMPTNAPVRIVGIGASAGGLEALERFFASMPLDSGLAFAVVQHLSPDFRSMMDELLARQSRLLFRHAVDGTQVEPNTVYLNPPRQNLVTRNGKLYLEAPDQAQSPSLPIDAFFLSLANDRGADAVAVILSGTGSDGTKGALAIRSVGGTVLVQEPGSAKFDSMPRSAIERGAVSVIALPDEMPTILSRLALGGDLLEADLDDEPINPEAAILRLLEKRFGANFTYYKKSTVGRRLGRRAALNGFQDLANYLQMLRRDPVELERLYSDLLIGVTAFFRDAPAFDALATNSVPDLSERMSPSRQLRIWVPGCASGEEAYTIAILFSEYARKNDLPLNIKIFATDLHSGSLETAGQGIYSADNVKELGRDILDRYFDGVGSRYQATASLRRLIVFSPHNLIKDPPFTRLDLISCRNLLIYFDEVAQQKVLALFHFALLQRGVLFLGPSETVSELNQEFEVLDNKWRIFRKLRNVQLPGSTRLLPLVTSPVAQNDRQLVRQSPRNLNGSSQVQGGRAERRLLLKAYDAVLERHAPPSLLVTRAGDLLHVFGNAHKYLRLRSGLFTPRMIDVIIEPLKLAVITSIDASRVKNVAPIAREVTYQAEDGREVDVQVLAETLVESGLDPDLILITFNERSRKHSGTSGKAKPGKVERIETNAAQQRRIDELERNLTFTEESLQTTIEELETSNEELQSTNQELMSANEELQSTNEELHAVNEELYSVSTEHQRKIDELTALTHDMDHLLRCTDVGTIFLDQDLKIRRFTPAVAMAFNLLDRDIGRPIEHITARFAYSELKQDVAKVADTAEMIERTVAVDSVNLLLRLFPFQVGDKTRGIVITLIDVSRLKQAERALEIRNAELAKVNASLEQFTYIVSHDLRAPLRTILNSAKWVEEDLGTTASEEVRGHCSRLMVYSKRLTDMLDDLMKYARLDDPNDAIEIIDLQQLLQTIKENLDGDDRLSLSCEVKLPPFKCQRAPFGQVFQNLIDNALKYSENARVALTVTAEDLGTMLRFTVADDGPGIPPRHHDKIFLPFRKLQHKDDKPGTGMGLALVKKAVEDNGGMIEVLSDPEKQPGTAFRFTWAKI